MVSHVYTYCTLYYSGYTGSAGMLGGSTVEMKMTYHDRAPEKQPEQRIASKTASLQISFKVARILHSVATMSSQLTTQRLWC